MKTVAADSWTMVANGQCTPDRLRGGRTGFEPARTKILGQRWLDASPLHAGSDYLGVSPM